MPDEDLEPDGGTDATPGEAPREPLARPKRPHKLTYFPVGGFFANELRKEWSAYGQDKRFFTHWHPGSLFSHPYQLLNAFAHLKQPDLRAELELDRGATVLGDSGGFQILKALLAEREPPPIDPLAILRWQERNTDVSFILDWPPDRAATEEVFARCLRETKKNCEIFEANQKEPVRMLRVLHGYSNDRIARWYDEIAPFSFGGHTGWSTGLHPSSDVLGHARLWGFLYSRGHRGYYHLLGINGLQVLPLLIYLAQHMEEVAYDSSTYACGYRDRTWIPPYALTLRREFISFGSKTSSHHEMGLPPCACPVCVWAESTDRPWWQMMSDAPLGGHLIAMHNLYQFLAYHRTLVALVQDRARFFAFVNDRCEATTYTALLYVDEVIRSGWERANEEFSRFFTASEAPQLQANFSKMFASAGIAPGKPAVTHHSELGKPTPRKTGKSQALTHRPAAPGRILLPDLPAPSLPAEEKGAGEEGQGGRIPLPPDPPSSIEEVPSSAPPDPLPSPPPSPESAPKRAKGRRLAEPSPPAQEGGKVALPVLGQPGARRKLGEAVQRPGCYGEYDPNVCKDDRYCGSFFPECSGKESF